MNTRPAAVRFRSFTISLFHAFPSPLSHSSAPFPLFRLPLFLLPFVFLTACATLAPRGVIDVSVVDIRPTQAALLETTAVLTLRFTNASPEPLQLKGSSHRLYLNGSSIGRAVSNDSLTIPALSTATQQVTVYLENLTLVRKATEFSRSPTAIAYRLESQLFTVDGTSATNRLRATATGELDIRGLMEPVKQ
ncbi:MAG TPA: LEA type 2 family protein [Opitutaceae bacterium]|nr:LEA type 2 family protein [Opitutaceae bacterium]